MKLKFKKPIIFTIATCILITGMLLVSDNQKASAQVSPDAIAVRVVPNPNSVSPTRWYLENIKNQGSPSQLIVDGYQAVRDGRSVYVSAANIGSGVSGVDDNKLYINIYILSYTQAVPDGEDEYSATQDIFGQLLDNWTFNVNILQSNTYGQCKKIKDNSETGASCFVDIHCNFKEGEYCASVKASLVRDVKRLADIRDIEMYLDNYYKVVKLYPKLEAGSYLPNRSISVWPSWQETLGVSLGTTLPTDPLNKLVCAPQYDQYTCWNENDQTFNGTVPLSASGSSGNVYQYISQNEGKNYQLCAVMETAYTSEFKGACDGVTGGVGVNPKPEENREPIIIAPNSITLSSGEVLNKYIQAYDPDGVIVKWEVTPGYTLKSTGSYTERILSHSAPANGIVTITVIDNEGGTASKEITIKF